MRKEVLWAIAAGIIFGLVVAFGAWRINLGITKKGGSSETPRPSSSPISEFKITLVGPENEDVVTESTIKVSGITKALVWVTISAEDGDYIIQSDEKGVFEEEVELTTGVNQIKITAFDPQGNQSVEKVLVVYSSAFEKKAVPTDSPETGSTEAGIRERVAQKLEETINKPKAYIGVVTDITDSTIQIKTSSGEIRQISVLSDETTVVKTTPTNKIVKLTDVAIGDFIVAMGYKNGNQVLKAQRILITPAVTEPKINVVYGKVTGAEKSALTISTLKENKEIEVGVTGDTSTLKIAEGVVSKTKFAVISEEDLVIIVNTNENDKSITRTIFLLPS